MRIVRLALVLLLVAVIGPSAANALATSPSAPRAPVRAATGLPVWFNVSGIEFSLLHGDNARPVNPSNRFAYGARKIWAFWAWDDAKSGSRVNYVLRFGTTDVAWGTLGTDARNGRMEVELERLDGLPFDLGFYRLYLDASGSDSGNVLSAPFEIYDPDAGRHDHDNGNGNDNGGDNGNDNGDNGNDNGGDNNDNDDDNGNDNG